MNDLLWAFEKQGEIIRIQSEVIDELFLILMQQIGAEEAEKLEVIGKINQAAGIMKEING